MHVSESRLCHTQTQSFPVLVRVRTHDNVVTDDGGHHVALGVVPSHVNHRAILDVRLRADLHLLHITCAWCACSMCAIVFAIVSVLEEELGKKKGPREDGTYRERRRHTTRPSRHQW